MSFSETLATQLTIKRLVVAFVIVGGLGGAGYYYKCGAFSGHKTSAQPAAKTLGANNGTAAATTNGVALKPGDFYLGEVTLTNHFETSVQLSNGKNCTLLARDNGHNVELTVALKSLTADGQTHDLSVTRVSAKSGKPMEIALGDYELSFTPNIQN